MATTERPQLEMGGQAVIEGVLMRTRQGYSVAIRRASGAIVVRSVPFRSLARKFPFLKWPLVRGGSALFEMLAIGYQALRFSAEEAEKDIEVSECERHDKAAERESPSPPSARSTPVAACCGLEIPSTSHGETHADDAQPGGLDVSSKIPSASEPMASLPQDAASVWRNWAMTGMFALSFAIAIGMMVVLPNLLAAGSGKLVAWMNGDPGKNLLVEETHPLLYNLVSGGFRAVILLGYIWGIGRIAEIRRVFQYHGAEHKAVFAYETGGPLTVERAQKFTTLHPRCGTSFLVIVLVVSIVVFAFVAWAYVAIWPGFVKQPFLIKKLLIFIGHIVMLPVVAGCSYEFLKFTARMCDRGGPWRWLVLPGMQVQKITTQPPDDHMVEVALVALESALAIQPDAREETMRILAPNSSASPRAAAAQATT